MLYKEAEMTEKCQLNTKEKCDRQDTAYAVVERAKSDVPTKSGFNGEITLMKKILINLSIIFLLLFVLSFGLYLNLHNDIFETLSVTFGVTSYHFIMRLTIGFVLDLLLKNNVNSNIKWFQEKSFESKIYKFLHVKKWKNHMSTYNKDYFDIKKHTIEEIIGASCQAELVHELIIIFSFLPIALCLWFDSDAVFIITSILSALLDSVFVIMQRYNRPRLKRIIARGH